MADCVPFTVDSVPVTSPYCSAPLFPTKPEDVKESDSGVIMCTMCNVKCCGRVPYEQHLSGSSHRRQLQQKGVNLVCTLCDLHFTSEENLAGHLNGQKHKRKLKQSSGQPAEVNDSEAKLPSAPAMVTTITTKAPSSGGQTTNLEITNTTFHCLACDLVCSSREQLTTHMSGKRHAKRCKQQAIFWVSSSNQAKPTETSPAKAAKRRNFFRVPKTAPETNPESLIKVENALPIIPRGGSDKLSALPFCLLASKFRQVLDDEDEKEDGEPICKRPCPVREADGTSKADQSEQPEEPEPVETRFCGHINCIIGRAMKFYHMTLQDILGPSHVSAAENEAKTKSNTV